MVVARVGRGTVNGAKVQGRVTAVMKQGFVKEETVRGSRPHQRRHC